MRSNIPECHARGSRAVGVSVIKFRSSWPRHPQKPPSFSPERRDRCIFCEFWRGTHLPARICDLATSLADYARVSSVSIYMSGMSHHKAVRARARCGVWRTVQTNNLSHGCGLCGVGIGLSECVIRSSCGFVAGFECGRRGEGAVRREEVCC